MRFFACLWALALAWTALPAQAQPHSVAREWNEVLLESIRNDYARPPVHARNLFHLSAAMYDAWAAYDATARPYFLNNPAQAQLIPFEGPPPFEDVEAARAATLSYACYRLIRHRFANAPRAERIAHLVDSLMAELGYPTDYAETDYRQSPAALGNYLAASILQLGLLDFSNEENDYANQRYAPVNPPLVLAAPGAQQIQDPNRWQPLAFSVFVDQAGNEIPGSIPSFLGPEWGDVRPFCLTRDQLQVRLRDNQRYQVYLDPGPPALLHPDDPGASAAYQWNHTLVALWSAHLDTADGVVWDISPASIGGLRLQDLPVSHPGMEAFYRLDGRVTGPGYAVNPKTQQPYAPQPVRRGDYTRVLAEFWADGPHSETPPGHWFTILNYVSDHPQLLRKFKGQGAEMDRLEWDVKSYFALGGAMHDAAIAAWGVKGYYDYVRPISAIRYLAGLGQSSDPNGPSYHPNGMPLYPGLVEVVAPGDPLAGTDNEHVGKIKLYAWRGHTYIQNPETDQAGAGWILAENWWPYQRPTFVTPPFAGYVSGHSTYSRAAARLLSEFTGDEYFPGGMGEFHAERNDYLVFEEGPSQSMTLQWAKYYDASDQCSLSRIWGGIHPPIDDLPGRRIGDQVGQQAFRLAESFFSGTVVLGQDEEALAELRLFPNPVGPDRTLRLQFPAALSLETAVLYASDGRQAMPVRLAQQGQGWAELQLGQQSPGLYLLLVRSASGAQALRRVLLR